MGDAIVVGELGEGAAEWDVVDAAPAPDVLVLRRRDEEPAPRQDKPKYRRPRPSMRRPARVKP